MDLFDLGRALHSSVGSVALVSFWVAALAAKGGAVHRRVGRIYLLALIGVMTFSVLMVTGRMLQGDRGAAIFLLFLISIVGTASWLMWFAIQHKHNAERLYGVTYRGLASWLVATGAGMLGLGIVRGVPLMVLLSLLGLAFGANMWRLALAHDRDKRWWLQQHVNGVMLNFIATHDSFVALGIGSVIPELRQPVPRMLIAATVITTALIFRVLVARRPPLARPRLEAHAGPRRYGVGRSGAERGLDPG